MIEFSLGPDYEKMAPTNPFHREFGDAPPLYHQLRTYEALEQTHLVVNSYNTGTGKTRAALLHLLRRPEINTLFIAPTNELLRQHANDIKAFVVRNGLPLDVLCVHAGLVRELASTASFDRQGSRLHALLQDPALALGQRRHPHYVLVINPDIFYYALYFRYGRLDQRNLFKDFLGKFDYLVVDELHYYNAKQLANFLFFLILAAEYGYFETGGRACLLTATLNDEVRQYLERLGLSVKYVTRATEPAESAHFETRASLAPVQVRLLPQGSGADRGLEQVIADERVEIVRQIQSGKQGAIISSALWRINRIWDSLRHTAIGARCGRLTGPEDAEARSQARLLDLILASPTVDLGYNFERGEKSRQNIDFLYFDARYSDEFLQRLGRAGRVLGKTETDIPSTITALCPDELVEAIRARAGDTLRREELAGMVREHLTPRHDLYRYIQSGAIGEAFLPIFRLQEMTEHEDRDRLQALFDRVKEGFAPNSERSYWHLRREVREFLDREILFHDWPAGDQAQVNRALDPFIDVNGRTYTASQREQIRQDACRPTEIRRLVEEWIETERIAYEVKRALYTFRESFAAPLALIYDPECLLSSQPVRGYDVFHIAANYQARWYRERAEWVRQTGQDPSPQVDAVAFCELLAIRPSQERLQLHYRYDSRQTRDEWQNRFTWGPTALRGIRVESPEGPLPREVIDALADRYVVCYARDPNARGGGRFGALRRHGDVRIDSMAVELDGETREYRATLGTAAFFAYAELGWMERIDARNRARTEGPIWI